MLELLATHPILLLFVVAGVGVALGRIRIGGVGLGVAAILFAGIGFAAVDPRLVLPEELGAFGLALFVYTIGLSSGPGFVSALRRRGVRANALVAAILVLCAGLTWGLAWLAEIDGPMRAGLFAGSLTNTPALAAIVELVARAGPADRLDAPVVGYSLAYPAGVLGTLAGVWVYRRTVGAPRARPSAVASRTVRVREPALVSEIEARLGGEIRVGRMLHGDTLRVATPGTQVVPGDLIVLVGESEAVERAVGTIGESAKEALDADRRCLDFRRIFLSNPRLAGARVGELDLLRRLGATITRVRRGDVDLVARAHTVLELGDRVRVVAPREHLAAIGALLGDSYRALAEVDLAAISLGLALGLLLGAIPIPFPGGGELRLGSAGGPLIAGLVLGTLHRTSVVTWTLPYAASLTLRQLGTMLFLAGVGTRAGRSFAATLSEGGALALFASGIAVTTISTACVLGLGHVLLRLPPAVLTGVLAGHQTQPATLAFAVEAAGDDQPNVGYSTVFPTAMVIKILLAQLLTGLMLD